MRNGTFYVSDRLIRAIVSDKSGGFSVQRGDKLRRLTMVMSQLLEGAKDACLTD
jgi:hypothetical protein